MRERERLLGPVGRGEVGEKMVRNKIQSEGGEKGEGEGEWVDVDEEKEERKKTQRVYVLERGFEGWQEKFGRDERLTEGWSEELWAAE